LPNVNELPEVNLYAVGPLEVDRVSNLMTSEAVSLIKSGDAYGIAITEGDEVHGAMCFRLSPENEQCLEILSIFVIPGFRRTRLATTMITETVEDILSETYGELKFATAVFSPDTEGARELFESIGFKISESENCLTFRTDAGSLLKNELLAVKAQAPAGCVLRAVSELSDYDVRMLVSELSKNGVDYVSASDISGSIIDASFVLTDASGTAIACSIFSHGSDGGAVLSQFYTASGANSAMAVLRASAAALAEKLPHDAPIEITTVESSSAGLVKKLLPDSKETKILHALLRV